MKMNIEFLLPIKDEIVVTLNDLYSSFEVSTSEISTQGYKDVIHVYVFHVKIFHRSKHLYILFRFSPPSDKKNIIEIIVSIIDNESTYGFNLKDYLALRGNKLEFDRSLFWNELNDYSEAIEISKKMFAELKKLIATEEMQKLLNTDYKIDVPRDWSPYK